MKQAYRKDIKALADACHRVAEFGLLRCSSGNMSCRLGKDLIAISASSCWLGDIKENQVAVCSLEDGRCINDKKPSVESRFHLGILRQRSDVNTVLHFQSPFATAVACGKPEKYNFSILLEIPFYIGKPAVVKFLPPGSEALANAVTKAARKHDMIILCNHGLVTVGRDFNDVIAKACFFELACQILLLQKNPQFLNKSAIESLGKNIQRI